MRIYLSGPMQHDETEGRGWREIPMLLDDEIDWVSPWDKHPEGTTSREAREEHSDEWIMETDRQMIRESDGVLVFHNPDIQSFGTAREVEYAVRELGKPIVVVSEAAGDRHGRSAWLADVPLFSKFEDAIEELKERVELEEKLRRARAAKRRAYSGDA